MPASDIIVVSSGPASPVVVTVGEVGPAGPPGFGLPGPAGPVFFIEPEQGDDGIPVPGPAGIPGAAGATGSAGATGPMGAVIFIEAEAGEDGAAIPGPMGPAGTPGVGLPGPAGAVMYLEPQDGEDGMPVPGPAGVPGAAGATGPAGAIGLPGPIFFLDAENGEDGLTVPGPVGATGGGGFTGGTLTSALNEAPEVTLAAAATVNIGAAAANTIVITGTTAITAFDAIAAGALRRVVFAGALTLTHNATSLILPTAANIATAAGDVAEFLSLGAGNWRCTGYTRATGAALAGGGSVADPFLAQRAHIGPGTFNANSISGDDEHLFEITNDPALVPGLSGAGKQLFRINSYGATGYGGDMHFCRYRGSLAVPSAVQSGDTFMSFGMRGWDSSGVLAGSAASWAAVATENWTGSAHGIKYVWQITANGSTTRANGMQLDSTGLTVVGALASTNFAGVASKVFSFNNTLTLAGTDGTTMTFPSASASVGYINIPQNSQSAAYTTVLADQGKHLLHPSADTTARTFTIDSNANVAFPVGTAITFINQASAGVVTIAITADTMRLAGAGTTGSRTLAANGVATAIKITATEWIISGVGLT